MQAGAQFERSKIMNEMKQSRSKELLQKVYDHLDSIDVTKLSMNELRDFLEVVQKGRFLESFGQMPSYALSGFGGANPKMFDSAGKTDGGNRETAADK